ncbi:MAG TPA: type II toxin-antitoxin system RelE/ParE family toxin [Verrucomicrobiae bacterium]|nr:type II toxin-antitoxin system RelE/ParE family toxin [Verrucomicrobiae bacterium]
MAYAVEFSPSAAREFRKLAPEIQRRLSPHIDSLAQNPCGSGAKKLKGREDLWRIRVGDYRIHLRSTRPDFGGFGGPGGSPSRRLSMTLTAAAPVLSSLCLTLRRRRATPAIDLSATSSS